MGVRLGLLEQMVFAPVPTTDIYELKTTEVGSIIFWGIIRFSLVLISFVILKTQIEDYGDWWGLFFLAMGIIVLYPAQIMYQRHRSRVRIINQNVLCVTCKHYAEDEALCTALDQHVTSELIPCETLMWESKRG